MAKLEGTLDIRETRETLKEPKSLCVVSSTSFPRWEEGHSNADLLGEVVRFNSSRKGHLNELQEENRLSDIIRGNLAIESVRNLSFLGIDVVLVDSHSSEQFLAKIKKIAKPEKGHLDIFPQTEKGYGEARRKALLEAPISLNSKYPGTVIMAEIEKKDLFLERNLVDLVTPIREGDADVVIPNRGFIIHDSVLDHPERWDEEFPGEFHAGYPPYQARSETWLNRELARTMTKCGFTVRGRWLDYLNGTRVFRADVTLLSQMMNVYKAEGKQVKHVDTDTYFSSVYAMFLNLGAIGKSGRIVEVPIRFTYPKAQALLEKSSPSFKEKRDGQRKSIDAAINGWVNNYLGHEGKVRLVVEDNRAENDELGDFLTDEISAKRARDLQLWRTALWYSGVDKRILVKGRRLQRIFAYNIKDNEEKPTIWLYPENVDENLQMWLFSLLDAYQKRNNGREMTINIPFGTLLPQQVISEYKHKFDTGAFDVQCVSHERMEEATGDLYPLHVPSPIVNILHAS